MLRRLLLYFVLIAAIAGFLLLRRPAPASIRATAAAAYPTLRESAVKREREAHRLNPDARFLDAVQAVEQIVTGRPAGRTTCEFADGGWAIRSGERPVGRVGEFPGYAELRGLLVGWARTLGAPESLAVAEREVSPGTARARKRGHAGIEAALGALHAVQAADMADRMWAAGHRDPVTARLGARALAWMTAECFDRAGAGEALAVRALAWSAIAAACDSAATGRDAALLAHTLGYPAGACAAVEALGDDDPIRLAVLRRDEVLSAIASRGVGLGGGARIREARWLALRRAVEREELEAWEVAAQRGLEGDAALAMPLLASQLALGRFETDVSAGRRLLLAVASDLSLNDVMQAPIAAIEERTLAADMELFETLLDSMPESADGAFLDRSVLRGWYRAAFYSSLFGIGEHLRRSLSSTEATRDFAAELGDGADGREPAREFARWYANLAVHKESGDRRAGMKADLIGMKHFGAAPRLRTWDAIREQASWADPFRRDCARYLEKRLDTRPEHLDAWGEILLFDLYDLPRGERLLEAAVEATHPRDLGTRGWWAAYRGDRRTLDRMLDDRSHRNEEMNELVRSLRFMTPEDSLRLDAVSERLVAENPDDWSIVGSYVKALQRRHRNERVRDLCGAWLARPDRSTRALEDVDARNRMANACLEDGRVEEGYQAIRSVVGSWQFGAMSIAAELLDRRGQGAEAETLAMLAWQRYPDNDDAIALVVDLFWRHRKPDLAAQALAQANPPLTEKGWQFVLGPRFARFQREQPKEAVKAVNAIIGHKLADWQHLGLLVPALGEAGRKAEAAALAAKVQPAGRFDAMSAIAAYGNLASSLGMEAALDWLEKQVPGNDPRQASLMHLYAYAWHHGEALWRLPVTQNAVGHAEMIWLARAATAIRDTVGTATQLEELKTYYSAPSPDPQKHFGRMLLGMEPVDSVLVLRLDPREESEACYYIGLHHQAAGDVAEAARWYTRCIAVNVKNNAEHHWSQAQLLEWVARNRSLERLTREARGGGAVAQRN